MLFDLAPSLDDLKIRSNLDWNFSTSSRRGRLIGIVDSLWNFTCPLKHLQPPRLVHPAYAKCPLDYAMPCHTWVSLATRSYQLPVPRHFPPLCPSLHASYDKMVPLLISPPAFPRRICCHFSPLPLSIAPVITCNFHGEIVFEIILYYIQVN